MQGFMEEKWYRIYSRRLRCKGGILCHALVIRQGAGCLEVIDFMVATSDGSYHIMSRAWEFWMETGNSQ